MNCYKFTGIYATKYADRGVRGNGLISIDPSTLGKKINYSMLLTILQLGYQSLLLLLFIFVIIKFQYLYIIMYP